MILSNKFFQEKNEWMPENEDTCLFFCFDSKKVIRKYPFSICVAQSSIIGTNLTKNVENIVEEFMTFVTNLKRYQ